MVACVNLAWSRIHCHVLDRIFLGSVCAPPTIREGSILRLYCPPMDAFGTLMLPYLY